MLPAPVLTRVCQAKEGYERKQLNALLLHHQSCMQKLLHAIAFNILTSHHLPILKRHGTAFLLHLGMCMIILGYLERLLKEGLKATYEKRKKE